jgi:hypothetical protein
LQKKLLKIHQIPEQSCDSAFDADHDGGGKIGDCKYLNPFLILENLICLEIIFSLFDKRLPFLVKF